MNGCLIPPFGWRCTREAGHPGPCAAWPQRRLYLKLLWRMLTGEVSWSYFKASWSNLGDKLRWCRQ